MGKVKYKRGFPCQYCGGDTSLRKVFDPSYTKSYWCPKCRKESIWTKAEKYIFPRNPKPVGPKCMEVY